MDTACGLSVARHVACVVYITMDTACVVYTCGMCGVHHTGHGMWHERPHLKAQEFGYFNTRDCLRR